MKTSVPKDYPTRIKRLRGQLGLTQAQFAARVGVSFASVNRWENGQSRVSRLAWQRILRLELLGARAVAGDDAHTPVVRESEHPYTPAAPAEPELDFSSDPEVVRAVAEGQRLAQGHLFNPAFATEISLIDPLPHQRTAVYEHMLPQVRLRFLLADDAGAGKTIMAGLYIREMLARRVIRRVLIVPPAGLVGNWRRELQTLFSLTFRIVEGAEARQGNPFIGSDSNLLIVSVDTLAGERMFSRLQDRSVAPYDLVIFDEAHKLSADREPDFRIRKTDRYRLAEAVAGIRNEDPRWQLDWTGHHLLLLTATPHMGKDFPYYCLWKLLEPEGLSTFDAFNAFSLEERKRHFIRRTKEEMVRYDGTAIYPTRRSDTLSYDLTQGEMGEQRLYDETTSYMEVYYNRARILNRSAARLAMSVFQRRLASSTYALMRSLERRLERLDGIIDDIQSGRVTSAQLEARQRTLDRIRDVFDEKTADEEGVEGDREENETVEDLALGGVVAKSLTELQTERNRVDELCKLAHAVYDAGEESKFGKLVEVLRDPKYRDEKFIIFTEHRDTLAFIVRRLEGMGFTGKVARIHGGMHYEEREEQVEFFRRKASDDGATFLVATDAAGEGINLQFCWLMVNYDIPWNPARLEQRMGRIHRYGQKHDPVVILNLIAGKTREGRVLKILLEKLERIRKELRSDKVFDVVGRLFEGVSLREYMEHVLTEEGFEKVKHDIEGRLTKEQVEALRVREQALFGEGGDVKQELPRLRADIEIETYRRLLPGYVQRFLEKAAPLMDIGIEGSLDSTFSLRPLKVGALDLLWPLLDKYPPDLRERLTVYRPRNKDEAVFLHPGEPLFDCLRDSLCSRFGRDALRGAAFVDATAQQPYLFHVALISVVRKAEEPPEPSGAPAAPSGLAGEEILEFRLVGLKQDDAGNVEECPLENLLLLKGGQAPGPTLVRFVTAAKILCEQAHAFALERVARPLAEKRRQDFADDLPFRLDFLTRGYDYQDAELAAARSKLSEKARAGDARAKAELTKIKERQDSLAQRREDALAALRREPELIAPGSVTFLAHALVVPSSDPADKKQQDAEVERIAVQVASAYEEANGATVRDVSTPDRARAAGLTDHPGFDLLSHRADGEKRPIEVKGRAGVADIELTENEWAKACNLRDRYWLYVVYDCASPNPRMLRVRDPFGKLLAKSRGGVTIGGREIFEAAEVT